MKRLFLAVLMIFFLESGAHAVMVTGCCTSTGDIASSISMTMMQASVSAAVKAAEAAITRTIKESANAQEAADANTASAASAAANSRMKAEIVAENKIDGINRVIYGLNPDAQCCAPDASYYLQRGSENLRDAMAMFAAEERNFGSGIAIDQHAKDRQFAKAAQNLEKNGAILTGDVFSEKQSDAWVDLVRVLFSDIKNPRPEKLDETSVDGARYLIQEARARELRVLLTTPFHEYGLMRHQQIPFKEVMAWAPNVDQPVIYEAEVNDRGIVDLDKPLTKVALGPNDKISMEALLRIVGDRFTSNTYLASVEGGDAANAMKAQLRLAGYEFYVLNEIRKGLMQNNMLLSIQLEPMLAKWNANTRDVLQR